jgi:hypothetical protein
MANNYINDVIPEKLRHEIRLTNLGFTYKNADNNLVCVYFGQGKTGFGGPHRLVCVKCTSGGDPKSHSSEVAVMEKLYYCAGVSLLAHHYEFNNVYAIVTERLCENSITLDEIVQFNGQKCHERINERNCYRIALSEQIVKKIFKQILDIANVCYMRDVYHLQWNDLKNYWIDPKTYQVQLWNFERSEIKKFAHRQEALEDEQRTVRQMGELLKTLIGDLKVPHVCRFIMERCFDVYGPSLQEVRHCKWFQEKNTSDNLFLRW